MRGLEHDASSCAWSFHSRSVRAAGFVQRGDLRPDRARRVRDTFLATGTADFAAVEAAGISPHVFDSWRRCLRYGLAGDDVRPVRRTAIDLESQLTTVVDAVVSRRDAVLEQSMCGLSLTDGEGTVLRQWVRDRRIGRWLERNDIVPTFVVDETSVGTTSGMCLLSGKPTMVRGPEHFFEKYDSVTSAGVPVVHPVTHRVVGSLNLTSRFEDTSPVLLSWVMDLVRDVQQAFQESATRRERILMNAYLSENRDVRHPLVALNEQTIITNATAARLLTSVDQALLWEHTSRAIHDGGQEARRLVLNNGTVVSVECKQITDGGVARARFSASGRSWSGRPARSPRRRFPHWDNLPERARGGANCAAGPTTPGQGRCWSPASAVPASWRWHAYSRAGCPSP